MNFDELNLDDRILDALYDMHFDSCTPIQAQAIPPLLEGRDLVGVAQTGTGKTAAYLLPIINRLCTENFPQDRVNCLIMAPTRELAQQIDQALEAFSYFLPVSGVAVYGGNDGIRYSQELTGLQKGADIIIATPGRLISHLTLGNVDLSHTAIFVLDEADRMLDMGFVDDIKKIVSFLPEKRQNLLFSATMPNEIQSLVNSILHDPVKVEIAIAKPAERIDQSAYVCSEKQKMGILLNIFNDSELKRVIVFSCSKKKVHELAFALKRKKLNVCEMHSDLDQKERDEVLRSFKAGKVDIIVSTDLLSRGIDIDDIEMVINYDVPHNTDDYVHRIGRTARANKYGKAITLINEKDQMYFRKIEKVLGKEVRKEPLPEGLGEAVQYAPSRQNRSGSNHGQGFQRNNNRNGRKDYANKGGNGKYRGGKPGNQGEHSHSNNRRPHPQAKENN